MKKILLILLILYGAFANAQKTTGGNHTYIAQRYEWLAGVFQALGLPSGGSAAFKTGQEHRAGAVYYDSTGADAGLYIWSGLAWGRAGGNIDSLGRRLGVDSFDIYRNGAIVYSVKDSSGTLDGFFSPNQTSTGNTLHNAAGFNFVIDSLSGFGINNPLPHASALVDIASTTKGILIPRMTTIEKDAIVSPDISLLVFDTDLNFYTFWDGFIWRVIGSGFRFGILGEDDIMTEDRNATADPADGLGFALVGFNIYSFFAQNVDGRTSALSLKTSGANNYSYMGNYRSATGQAFVSTSTDSLYFGSNSTFSLKRASVMLSVIDNVIVTNINPSHYILLDSNYIKLKADTTALIGLETVTDSTIYKAVVADASGILKRMNSWPGSGVGGSGVDSSAYNSLSAIDDTSFSINDRNGRKDTIRISGGGPDNLIVQNAGTGEPPWYTSGDTLYLKTINGATTEADSSLTIAGGITESSTNTLTNKRWTARVGSTTSSGTPTINTDNYDIYKLTAQAANITSFTTNLTGTPVDGDILEIQVTGTGPRTISWGASFVSSTVILPTTTVTTATLTTILQYYTTSSYGNNKWVCVNSF